MGLIEVKRAAAEAGGEKVDLLSQLLDAKINGAPIQTDKLIALCFLLFLGGLDTVTNALNFAIRYLAGDKALQKRLHAAPVADRESAGEGKMVDVRVDIGGC